MFSPLKATARLMWPLVNMSLTPLMPRWLGTINEGNSGYIEKARDSKESVWVSRHRRKTTGNEYILPQKVR